MTILEHLEFANDNEIRALLLGRNITISFKDGSTKIGIVTNFFQAAISDDLKRSIVGVVLNGSDEIVISSGIITNITIIA